jgi:hypothetical protein
MTRPPRSGADWHSRSGLRVPFLRIPETDLSNVFGPEGTPAPEGMRKLSAAELAVNTVWTWDAGLSTYTSPEYPTGIPS